MLVAITIVAHGAVRRLLPHRSPVPVLAIALGLLLLAQPLAWNGGPTGISHPADDFGRAVAHAYTPGDVIATGLLGRIGYYAPAVPFEDIYGLIEPAIGKSDRPAFVFGKFDPAYTASTNPTLIVNNAWGDLREIADMASAHYVALVGPSLTARHFFVVVRADAADRYLLALRASFSDIHLDDEGKALDSWSTAFPYLATQQPP
jgi:hypothetical protein